MRDSVSDALMIAMPISNAIVMKVIGRIDELVLLLGIVVPTVALCTGYRDESTDTAAIASR